MKKMWAFACIFAAWRFPAPASRKPGKEEAEAQEGGRARDSGCQATLVTPSTSCVRASDHCLYVCSSDRHHRVVLEPRSPPLPASSTRRRRRAPSASPPANLSYGHSGSTLRSMSANASASTAAAELWRCEDGRIGRLWCTHLPTAAPQDRSRIRCAHPRSRHCNSRRYRKLLGPDPISFASRGRANARGRSRVVALVVCCWRV